jgi:hypothetical protein
VEDSTGAVVPRVTVTVTNTATGISDSAVANQQGTYTFPLLSPAPTRSGSSRAASRRTCARASWCRSRRPPGSTSRCRWAR